MPKANSVPSTSPLNALQIDRATEAPDDGVGRRSFLAGLALAAVAMPTLAASEARSKTVKADRHVLESYAAWLHMERRLLCRELYPHMGSEAERFVFADNAGFDWHFSGQGDLEWDQAPQPSSRAVAVLDLAGVDCRRKQPNHPAHYAVDNGDRPPLPANWPKVHGELRQAFDDIVEWMPLSRHFTKNMETMRTAEMII
jgi:hypothetical protein